ncbi:MAG: hypothetical protein ABIH57_02680 [Candidatus Omnitrophota bacterium]
MKKIIITFVLLVTFNFTALATDFRVELETNPSKEQALTLLTETVRLFDKHAQDMGGAGFFYGIKSKLISLLSDSHRDALQKYILWTPLYMLAVNKLPDDGRDLGKTFVTYCNMVPSAYDTYESCRDKVFLCVRVIYPDKDDKFYNKTVQAIRRETGAEWL